MEERALAVELLVNYEKEHIYLNIALNHAFAHYTGKKELVSALVYGTVQYRLRLAYELEPFIKGKRIKVFERMLLLMSMYEHLYMHMPDYAIVNSTVELCKQKKGKRSASFVNAVLRNAFAHPRNMENLDDEHRLSIETSHPLWMVKMLTKQYGFDETRKIMQADNEVPYKTARVNTLKTDRESLMRHNNLFKASSHTPDCVFYSGGNIADTKEFKEGLVTIQDESSQMPALLLNAQAGMRVLDMCAAPGSKTTQVAALMNNQGHIDAYDLYDHKVKLIEDNAKRLGVSIIETHCGDATDLSLFDEQYDAILLDGPCSGLGVLARKPEIRYHDSQIMDEIIPIQKKLLENAYTLCKINGNIVYSTCTINKKENEKQIEAFLKGHPDMKKLAEKTILPYMYHSDGFYMCLLKKE